MLTAVEMANLETLIAMLNDYVGDTRPVEINQVNVTTDHGTGVVLDWHEDSDSFVVNV